MFPGKEKWQHRFMNEWEEEEREKAMVNPFYQL